MNRPNIFSRLLEILAAVGLLGIVVTLLFQLIARTFALGSFSWTDEFARYLMISLVFLGAPAVLDVDQHIKVDYFVDRIPVPQRRIALTLSAILVAVFCGFLAYSAIDLMTNLRGSRTPALRMPMPLFLAGVVVGSVALTLSACTAAYRQLRSFSGSRSEGQQ